MYLLAELYAGLRDNSNYDYAGRADSSIGALYRMDATRFHDRLGTEIHMLWGSDWRPRDPRLKQDR